MKCVMDIHEIMQLLPHRPPFLLIDKVIEMVEGEYLVAIKNVTMNEPFFVGHFPEKPIMPGVLILEAMAQAAAVLGYRTTNTSAKEGVLCYFAGIDNARFRRVVGPGDQLRLEVKLLWVKKDIWKLVGTATVDGEVVCSADLLSARRG